MTDYKELGRLLRADYEKSVGGSDSRSRKLEAAKAIEELENPSFEQWLDMCDRWLLDYPPDIFDGSSGDPGPLFVVALRDALRRIREL